jgi:uncharacterized protein YciI
MLYALICTDKEDALERRMASRADHLAWLEGLGATLVFAGPFMSDDGSSPIGSLLVVEASSRADVEALAEADPYASADVFASVDIRPWKWLINPPQAS